MSRQLYGISRLNDQELCDLHQCEGIAQFVVLRQPYKKNQITNASRYSKSGMEILEL